MDVLPQNQVRQLLIEHTGVDPETTIVCHPPTYRNVIKEATEDEHAARRRISEGVGSEADQQTVLGLITKASVRACHACALEPNEQLHRWEAARLVLILEEQGRRERGASR